MASICFVGPYPPIMCGIATYTNYLTNECPDGKWAVLSFDLETYGAPLTNEATPNEVWYGMPNRNDFSASHIVNGLNQLNIRHIGTVLWFQHETGIWASPQMFVAMLKQLKMPKVVTLHTIHFQSDETPMGLRQSQYDLLKDMLPHVDAVTVFTYGVYRAVISAFPEHFAKIYVTKHGVHSYPEIYRLSRKEAREKLFDFLLYESELDRPTKKSLHEQHVFSDPNALLIGQTGFLCPLKYSESLHFVREKLQSLTPHKRIIAVRIGTAREHSQKIYAQQLQTALHDTDTFLMETWLPPEILPLAQRAFDINFYWPEECTQSGVVAHALGAGAIVAGRDLEGVGETLREAGQPADTDIDKLTMKIKHILLDRHLRERTEEKGLDYAEEFSWQKQAQRHYELAEPIVHTTPLWERAEMPTAINSIVASAGHRTKPVLPTKNQRFSRDTTSPINRTPSQLNSRHSMESSSEGIPENHHTKSRGGLLSHLARLRERWRARTP